MLLAKELKYQYDTEQHNTMAFVYVFDCFFNDMYVFRIQSHEWKEKEVETPKVGRGRGRGFRNTGKQRPSMDLYIPKGCRPAAFSREINNTQGELFTGANRVFGADTFKGEG